MLKDLLTISEKGCEIYKQRDFNNLIGMLYGPTDLPTFNEFIKISISVAEEGKIKKISHYNVSNSLIEI